MSREEGSGHQRLRLLVLLLVTVLLLWRVDGHRIDWRGEGTLRILVLQLAPAEQEPSAGQALLAGPASQPGSIRSIGPWLHAELLRFQPEGGPDFEVSLLGPFVSVPSPPDVREPDLNPAVVLWRSWAYFRYFDRLAADLGVDLDDYDLRIFLVHDAAAVQGDLESLSVADGRQRFGVTFADPAIPDPGYTLITLLHELGHTLGGTDKYDPDSYLPRWPEGYAEPRRDPPLPQRYGELMAVDIPITPDQEREARGIEELRVGAWSAEEFGWIDREIAERSYQDLPAQAEEPGLGRERL